MERISILMGIYNCEKTLEEAIDSLLKQSYKKWKLIMVDDGSQDQTYQIAARYADKYENIYLYKNNNNMGLNYTLNHCLKYADTEYIARMDGDDISMPTRLQKELDFLDMHKEYAIVSSSMIAFDESGEWGIYKHPEYPKKIDFIKGSPFCHAPCMIRTEAIKSVNGYSVEKKLLRMEDYHLWIKLYSKGYKGYNIQEPLYMMRDDRNATSRRKYRYRLNEAYVRKLAIKKLRLPIYGYVYMIRPLIVGLLPENWDSQMNINLKGNYFLVKNYVEYLEKLEDKSGNIVVITSERAFRSDDIPYGLTKVASNSFIKCMASKIIKEGIRINGVAPGVTESAMTGVSRKENMYADWQPANRFFIPEEVAEVVNFLLSDVSNCISGEVIACDQGRYISHW